jgi:hypothetical protein
LKITNAESAGGVVQAGEHLPNKQKALSSKTQYHQKERKIPSLKIKPNAVQAAFFSLLLYFFSVCTCCRFNSLVLL